ncbi:MAG: hypothetical protein PVJ63_01165 [Thioalkalispiraceae bacterium]
MLVRDEGVAVACIQRDAGQTPRLLMHGYTAISDHSQSQVTLRSLVKTTPCKQSPVSSVLMPGDFELLMVEEPAVPESELRQATRWKIKDMLDFSIDEAVVDVFSVPGQKERGRTPMVYAVAANKNKVQQCISDIEQAELALEYIDIPELVQRNIAALLPEDSQGVALLHLDAHSGLITLTQQSVLYLARDLEVGFEDLLPGEKSWVEEQPGGMELEPGGMSHALLDSITLEIQRSLDYYESHFAQPPINHLYIAPLAKDIPGLISHLAGNLGVQVQMLDLNNLLDCSAPISQQEQSNSFLAIGAALRETA